MPNRLAKETSPYLQQHANNPVDWYPWGEEALTKAKGEDKPILVSIGYSACHWCHVMEKESFEDHETAQLMNGNFVSIKVDREERPDLDAIYMDAVQAITGQGGWPMTVFLTPEGKPFYGGTYFPPEDRGEIPSFKRVLTAVADAYKQKRQEVEKSALSISEALNHKIPPAESFEMTFATLENAFLQFTYSYDRTNGGFGGAPKFPQPSILELLLWLSTHPGLNYGLRMVEHTLTKMARGGIYDHVGGGFHRYSVDSHWLVPHFEKMLYDNAQLSLVYLHAYQATQKPLFKKVVEETLDYVISQMRHLQGGFFSTQDADSEGEEGKYYIWSKQEIEELLGKEKGRVFCEFFNVSEEGNFDGKNILNISSEPEGVAQTLEMSIEELNKIVDEGKKKVFDTREKRVSPARDDKVMASWNGLMMRSFSEATRVLKRDDYKAVAEANAKFVSENMIANGRLMHTWKDGVSKANGLLEDYAFLADGFLSLYQTTFDPKWFESAYSLTETILNRFQDPQNGGFYDTPSDHEQLIARPKNTFDYSIPSAGSIATKMLLLLYGYTGESRFREASEKALKSIARVIDQQPTSVSSWLTALGAYLSPPVEVALVGESNSESLGKMLSIVFEPYRPNLIVALQVSQDGSEKITLLKGKAPVNNQTTAYICRRSVCERPTIDPAVLAEQLNS
ncbi:MAG: thioredoxin domain-containing protein [Thaumarchaeota archaeon]|nr:thioredoxin domain-containing protein [Nitrososphaerota archaeon]